MYVVIVGGGRTGTQLARFLFQQNHQVSVVEDRKEIISLLHRELPTESITEGNPLVPEVLEHAGIKQADVLVAVTTLDEVNLVLCYLAREKYKVRRTIARMNNPRDAWLFGEPFRVDVALNQAEILARLIEEEMSMGDMVTLLKLRRGNYSLVEEKVPENSPSIGIAIKDMPLDKVVIAAIIRHGEVIVPRGISTFEAGDEVLAVTDAEGTRRLENFISRGLIPSP